MTQNRKYLGMTTQQIAILGGLAALACVLFTVAGCFFLQGAPRMFAPAPQNTLPPQITDTPFVLPTLAPTETLTPVPYEMLVPEGWVQFKTELVEIWLPKEFQKEKIKADDSGLTTELKITGFAPGTSMYPMGVLVSYEPIAGDSLDVYVNDLPAQLSQDVRVAEKGKVTVNSVEAVRLMLEMKIKGVDFNDLIYVFRDGGTVWVIQYIAQINDYYLTLPTFDQSIKTFRVVR